MPQVSVIMNCYNSETYLTDALDSLKNQSFEDYEVIFWDNDSTDGSAAIAQGFGPKLRYFRSDKTMPLGAARNLAIAQAQAPYIAFLDCDDLWLPEKLERQVALMRPDVGLVYTDTEIFTGDRVLSRVFENSPPARGHAFRELVLGQFISMSSAMIHRVALDATRDHVSGLWFDENLNVCEEADLFYRIAHDFSLDFVDAPLTRWRSHGSSTTFQKFGQFATETRLILSKLEGLYPTLSEAYPDVVATMLRRADFQEALSQWRNGQNARARQLISPHLGAGTKYRIFWWTSFLPGGAFDALARLYFSLPKALRRGH